jgi:hypothetical protein
MGPLDAQPRRHCGSRCQRAACLSVRLPASSCRRRRLALGSVWFCLSTSPRTWQGAKPELNLFPQVSGSVCLRPRAIAVIPHPPPCALFFDVWVCPSVRMPSDPLVF